MSKRLEVEELQHPFVGEDEDDEDEEALSLCDLPVTSTRRNEAGGGKEEENQTGNDSDFDFGSLIGSLAALESEMCAADEVFCGGQMLPFRHSVSSEVRLSGFRVPTRNYSSRSDSKDRVRLGSRSTSSRSSSTRSQQSAASSTSSSSSSSMVIPKPKARNHFHSYPSPKPQIRSSGARPVNCSGTTKSTMWQVLRLGLVRTPEIELQDLKLRYRTSKNIPVNKTTRSDSVSSSSSNHDSNKIGDLPLEVRRKQENRNRISNDSNKNGGGIFGSCKCSVGAIDPIIISPRSIKPTDGSKTSITTQNNKLLSGHDDEIEQQQQKEHQQRKMQKEVLRQRKRVGSHQNRTFEWLRDLSQTSVLNS